jgi:hypothetical protein
LCFGFHAFCNHWQPQTFGQHDHHFGDGRVIGVEQDVANETLVDLELIQQQLFEVGQ